MKKVSVYHNPSCSTSNKAIKLLKELGVEIETILYLKDHPSASELKALLKKLNIPAEALIRKKESIFQDNFKGKTFTEDEWIEIMVQYPKLIERPIVVYGSKAVIARPLDKINELIKL